MTERETIHDIQKSKGIEGREKLFSQHSIRLYIFSFLALKALKAHLFSSQAPYKESTEANRVANE